MNKKATVVYYAKTEEGIILQDDSFRNVYDACKHELKGSYGHSLFYDIGSAKIYEGVYIEWDVAGKYYSRHIPIRLICTMTCSSVDKRTHFSVRRDSECSFGS